MSSSSIMRPRMTSGTLKRAILVGSLNDVCERILVSLGCTRARYLVVTTLCLGVASDVGVKVGTDPSAPTGDRVAPGQRDLISRQNASPKTLCVQIKHS